VRELYNVTEVESAIANLSNTYPALCSLVTLPEATTERRISHALRISSDSASRRPMLLVTAGLHGREWGLADVMLGFATDLLAAYATNQGLQYGGKTFSSGQVKSTLDTVDLMLFPLVNPDGYAYSISDPSSDGIWWRKNRNSRYGERDHIGADLARNFDFVWDFGTKLGRGNPPASNESAQHNFHGATPFSEPEAVNVRWLLDSYPQIHWFIDVHSPSGSILYSWGHDENQSEKASMNFRIPAYDGFRGAAGDSYKEYIPASDARLAADLAAKMKQAISDATTANYKAGQSFSLYGVSGAPDDYAYSRQWAAPPAPHVLAFVIELGSRFHPFPDELEKMGLELGAALLQFGVAVSAS
jgi:murein tripeptide amidase MpaA